MLKALEVWLAASAILAIVTNSMFFRWLRRRTQIAAALIGVPGYLDWRYVAWCRQEGVDWRLIIGGRILLFMNLLLALATVLPIIGRQ